MLQQIEHRFIPGIRFDTQLAYATSHGGKEGRNGFEALPTLRMRDAHQALLVSILQATGILSGMRRRDLLARCRQRLNALGAERSASKWDTRDAFAWMEGVSAALDLKHIALNASVPAKDWQFVTEPGVLYLLGLRVSAGTRWSLVVGIEQARTTTSVIERALLVLDSQVAEPWATGHNARLELRPGSARSPGKESNPNRWPLAYRCLDGEAHAVELCGLVEMKLRRS